MKPINKYFDHTILKPEATSEDIINLCREAIDYDFYSVCINSCYVPLAVKTLSEEMNDESSVKVAAVAGFPLGAMAPQVKAEEAAYAASAGADEIDMVINIGALKEGKSDYVLEDIKGVVERAGEHGAIVKVILETCLLTDEEIVEGCRLSKEAGAAFVKTSTGFSSGGALERHIRLMKDTVKNTMQIKASGGIRDLKTALLMIEAGADRIGASASVNIVEEYIEDDSKDSKNEQ